MILIAQPSPQSYYFCHSVGRFFAISIFRTCRNHVKASIEENENTLKHVDDRKKEKSDENRYNAGVIRFGSDRSGRSHPRNRMA